MLGFDAAMSRGTPTKQVYICKEHDHDSDQIE